MSDLRERLEELKRWTIFHDGPGGQEPDRFGALVRYDDVLAALDQPELGEERRCPGKEVCGAAQEEGAPECLDCPDHSQPEPTPLGQSDSDPTSRADSGTDPPEGFERAVEAVSDEAADLLAQLVHLADFPTETKRERARSILRQVLPHLQPEQGGAGRLREAERAFKEFQDARWVAACGGGIVAEMDAYEKLVAALSDTEEKDHA